MDAGGQEPSLGDARLVPLSEALVAAYRHVMHVVWIAKQPMSVAWTAMSYFHHFFTTAELESYPLCFFASTCVFVASKLTESPMSLRDAINAYYTVQYPKAPPLAISPAYWKLRESFVVMEQRLLRSLRFQLLVHIPYPFLLQYGRAFGFAPEVVRMAWAILNDAMTSDCCIRHAAHVLAAGALSVAVRILGTEPTTAVLAGGKKWYQLCDVTETQLSAVSMDLLQIQQRTNAAAAQ